MEKSEAKENMRWGIWLLLFQAAETALCRYVLGAGFTDIAHCTLWMLLLGGIAVGCLVLRAGHFPPKHIPIPVVSLCVLIAVPCALFYDRLRPMAAFYLGAVLIAALVDPGTGMVFVFYFCAAAMLKSGGGVEEMTSLLALGVVLCLLAGFLEKRQGLWEVFVLAGIVTAVLYFLRTSLHGEDVSYEALGLALFSTTAVLLCAVSLISMYTHFLSEKTEVSGNLTQEKKGWAKPEPEVYEALLAPDAMLMARMEQEAKPLYLASKKLAALAGSVAGSVEADALHCQVLAMYRGIGSLGDGQENMGSGIVLLQKAGMPAQLMEELAEINQKEPKPYTKELAVVLLAAAVMKVWSHEAAQSENVTQDKVIDKVFAVLLNKGVLDEAGFSVKEYGQLKKSLRTELALRP